jgi:hypothetical protein
MKGNERIFLLAYLLTVTAQAKVVQDLTSATREREELISVLEGINFTTSNTVSTLLIERIRLCRDRLIID